MSVGFLAQIVFIVHLVPTEIACNLYRGDTSAFPLASGAASLGYSFLQPFDLSVTLANIVGAGGARLGDKLLCACCVIFQLMDGGLSGFELRFEGGFLGICNVHLTLSFRISFL